jgi:hypothetical protein
MFSETGDELISTQSDEFGNTHFVLPTAPDDLLLLTLTLNNDKQQLFLRVSGSKKPA